MRTRYVSGGTTIYPTSLKNRIFGFAKASRLNDHKRVHISNIDPFMIVQSRELSLKPKTDFSITLGIYSFQFKRTHWD